jgi:hypothetical protein
MEKYLIEKLYFTVFGKSQLKYSDRIAPCTDNNKNTASTNNPAAISIAAQFIDGVSRRLS